MRALLRRQGFRDLIADALIERDAAAERLAEAVREGDPSVWPLRPVWLGVSAEDALRTRERLPLLAATPAVVKFVSAEPFLEAIDDALTTPHNDQPLVAHMDWVIVGGESGSDARPMAKAWATGVRDACLAYGVPFFFKQWGGRTPKAGGRELDGRTWDQMPEPVGVPGEAVSA